MNFLLRTPFFRLLLALAAGMLTFRYCLLPNLLLWLLALSALVAFIFSVFANDRSWSYRLRWLFGLSVLLMVYLMGYALSFHRHQQLVFHFPKEPVVFRLLVLEKPEVKARSVLCVVRPCLPTDMNHFPDLPSVSGSFASKQYLKAIVYLQKDSLAMAIQPGDVILARLRFQTPAAAVFPESFDYAAYLRNKGIVATAFADSLRWKKVAAMANPSPLHLAERTRNRLLDCFRKLNLPPDDFAVLAALTLGYKDELEPEIRAHYSASGAMHILSVSGLHVGVVYLLVNMVLSFLFKGASTLKIKTVGVVVMLWCYAFVTGLPPSVVRASAMFSMVAVGKALERKAQIFNTISATAFVLLLANPAYLSDLGFQLSYAAVLGIVYFQPKIVALLTVRNRFFKWCWELGAVSLSAQLATMPLALYYFNQFPNYFLLTNYVAIPLATAVIYTAVLFLTFGMIPFLGDGIGWLLSLLLAVQNGAIGFIHDLPGSVVHLYAGSLELGVMIVVLLCCIGYAELKKYFFIPVALGAVLLLSGVYIYRDVQALRSSQVMVYADRQATHVQFVAGRCEWVISSDTMAFQKLAKRYRLKYRLNHQQFMPFAGSSFFVINGKRIAIVSDERFRRMQTDNPIRVDILIVQRFTRQRADELLTSIVPQVCVVGTGVSGYYTQQLRELCVDRGIIFSSLAETGVYQEVGMIN
jgi:competence protein ComEC